MFSLCLGLFLVSIKHYKFKIIRAQNQEKQTLIRFLFFLFFDRRYGIQNTICDYDTIAVYKIICLCTACTIMNSVRKKIV